MKILFLTYYFEPDLCAGSFRNTPLFKELVAQLNTGDIVDVISTQPNRYDSYKLEAKDFENYKEGAVINRIKMPKHGSGILGQIKSFANFYFKALKLSRRKDYDLVYASSSRLFTAFLGAKIAKKNKVKLYLDIRDIFRETITDLYTNKIIRFGFNLILKPIENYTFSYAHHINLVSKGFESYFSKFKTEYSYFTNGIDSVFLSLDNQDFEKQETRLKTIVYGGNIGAGQGLDLIIPQVAEELSNEFKFIIIGDGGVKYKLEREIEQRGLTNVELIPPVSRNKLISYYQKADFLFLHLNKHNAFERVLPSKLFEYSTFNKPIIAGVGGYAKKFLAKNMLNCILFEPLDSKQLIIKLSEYNYQRINRINFKKNFSRKEINIKMAKSIIKVANG